MPLKIPHPRIGIVGGSISGLRTAIGLRHRGIESTIFESQYPYQFEHPRGRGVILSNAFMQKAISENLFDTGIPRLPPITGRSFLTKDDSAPQQARTIWKQPFLFTPLNWSHIYSNLRKQIPDEHYLTSTEVTSILQDETQCYVEARGAHGFIFDRVILANGMGPSVGKKYFPVTVPNYSGYVAWNGVVTDQKMATLPLFCDHSPAYLFPNGYLVFYQTPAHDYEKSHDLILNWSMHVLPKDISPSELLVGRHDPQNNQNHIAYLHALALKVLPAPIAEIICQTKLPTIQPIFDFQRSRYVEKRICLIGKAAAVLRPHTVSDLQYELESSARLAEAFFPYLNTCPTEVSLSIWSETEVARAKKLNTHSCLIGDRVIHSTPKVYSADWLKTIIEEAQHLSTSPKSTETDQFVLEQRKQFTPSLDQQVKNSEEVEKLCTSIEKVRLDEAPLSNSPRPKGIYR
jgi:2-polyprenyl-6-methoxyphenol hydroxylase-like FAD-dependent oxidoreductase